jgi:phage replication O-like protein O
MNDNYTPIHNDVLEALSKINLSSYETRVLFCIWRKTYGFIDPKTKQRKKIDWISGSQISEMTGLDRRYVSRVLKSLKDKNVISRGDKKTGFSKEFMKTMSSVEVTNDKKEPEILSSVEVTPVLSTGDSLSSVQGHTKENKENIQNKKIPFGISGSGRIPDFSKKTFGNPDVNEIVSYFKETMGLPLIDYSDQKNRKYAYLLLKKFKTVEKIKLLIDTTKKDPFWSTKVASLVMLYYKAVTIISSGRDMRFKPTEIQV